LDKRNIDLQSLRECSLVPRLEKKAAAVSENRIFAKHYAWYRGWQSFHLDDALLDKMAALVSLRPASKVEGRKTMFHAHAHSRMAKFVRMLSVGFSRRRHESVKSTFSAGLTIRSKTLTAYFSGRHARCGSSLSITLMLLRIAK
jgi:hypothetical protein